MVSGYDETSLKLDKPVLWTVSISRLFHLFRDITPDFDDRAIIEPINLGFEEAVEHIRARLENERCDAVIAAGSNAAYLKSRLPVPVVVARASGFDVMQALARARRIAPQMGIITYQDTFSQLSEFQSAFGLRIAQRTYLIGATVMAVNTGDVATATARAEETITLCEQLDLPWGTAYATFMLGNLAADRSVACRLYESARQTFHELGDDHSELLVTRHLAWAHAELGDRGRARQLHEANLARARAAGNDRITASTLGALAQSAIEDARMEDAVALLRESLVLHRRAGDVLDTSADVCRLAAALVALGDPENAARLLAGFEALGEHASSRRIMMAELNARTLDVVRAGLGDDAFAAAWRGCS